MCLSPTQGPAPREVESLVTTPAEHIASEIDGVEHLYSALHPRPCRAHRVFKVGEPRTDAPGAPVQRLLQQMAPGQPRHRPSADQTSGIDDVPIPRLALFSCNRAATTSDLVAKVARNLQNSVTARTRHREIGLFGGGEPAVLINLSPARLASPTTLSWLNCPSPSTPPTSLAAGTTSPGRMRLSPKRKTN